MKVKNLMFSGFAAAMFAGVIGGADAATYNLASKDYVDTKITDVDAELQAVNTAIEKKQDKLTAGAGVTITESDDGLTTTIDTKPVMIGENEVSVADAITNVANELENKVDKTTYNDFVVAQEQIDAEQDEAIALIKGGEDGANGIADLADRVSDAEAEIDTLQTDKEDVANKVQTKTAYDALGAQDDKTKLYTSVEVAEAIAQSIATSTTSGVEGRVDTLEATVGDAESGLVADVDALETAVGDANSGLVKDVTDLKSVDTAMGDRVGALETDVNTLETTVGDANSGLVKDVTDLKTADTTMGDRVGALETDVNTLETTVGDANSGLVKDVTDLKSADTTMGDRVGALETDVANLKTADTEMDGRVDTLEGSVQTLQDANYINTDGKDLGGYIIKATGDGGYELLDVAIVDGTGQKDLITNNDLVTVTE